MKSALRQDMGADFINFSFLQSNTALNPANYTQKTPAVQQTTDVFLLTKIFFSAYGHIYYHRKFRERSHTLPRQ